MAIVYSTTVKNNRLQKVIDNMDAAASFATLVIGTASLSGATGVLATITLPKPSATISAGVLTLSGVPITTTATATGTAAKAELRDSTGLTIASNLTVGTTGTDIIINATAVSVNQTVQLNSGSITHG
jgi:hypothetical protein